MKTSDDRFFNSLVLAVYGGKPDWLEIGIRGTSSPRVSVSELSEEARNSVGFLRFSGEERLFAIDGQHRLSGIKRAMESDPPLASELVPVIFVGHANTRVGMRRTRRLFTTLNKTAVPVSKRDIIALDEDDVMAITVRDLYENDSRFSGSRIAVIASNNLHPTTAPAAFTTIGNLYDVLKLLFMHDIGTNRDTALRFNRPSDGRLRGYKALADRYFTALSASFPELDAYFRAKDPLRAIRKVRSTGGGHVLFRPIGLELITRAVIAYAQEHRVDVSRAVRAVAGIETKLDRPPYLGVIWDSHRGTVIPGGKAMAKRLLFYSLGLSCNEDTLLDDYKKILGGSADLKVSLPSRVI